MKKKLGTIPEPDLELELEPELELEIVSMLIGLTKSISDRVYEKHIEYGIHDYDLKT